MWKPHKTEIQRERLSHLAPKLGACIGFLHKVVLQIGCFSKFILTRRNEFNVFHMANSVFSQHLCLYTFHTLWGCEIFPKHSLHWLFMKILDRSHVTSSHQRFLKLKNLKKNWQENANVCVKMEHDWSGSIVLLCERNNAGLRWDVFYWNPLGSYQQSKFFRLVTKLKILHNFPMDFNKKNPSFIE